jgi:hypothetical protein
MEEVAKQVALATISPERTSDHALKVAREKAQGMLESMKPKDHIEAMMQGQLIALNHAMMHTLLCRQVASGVAPLSGSEIRNESVVQVAKLSKCFISTVETLNRYRHQDKLYQNLTVGHVDVHHGGQAVVGGVIQAPA